jgi:DNA-binding response OmpR family regulator
MRLLIVEDDDFVADAVARSFAADMHTVQRVRDAESAINALQGESFDLAVLDIGLPGNDGLSLLRRLRRDGNAIPTLILTAREWLLLECLVRRTGLIVSKEHLLDVLAGPDQDLSANAVEVHVSRLRGKIGDAATIRSLRGLGYRLEEPKSP